MMGKLTGEKKNPSNISKYTETKSVPELKMVGAGQVSYNLVLFS